MGRPALAAWRGTHDAIGAHPEELDALFEDALVLATQGTSVVRRDADGPWRYAISLLAIDAARRRSGDCPAPVWPPNVTRIDQTE